MCLGKRSGWESGMCTNMSTKSVMDCILGKGNWSGVVRDIISKILSHSHHKIQPFEYCCALYFEDQRQAHQKKGIIAKERLIFIS